LMLVVLGVLLVLGVLVVLLVLLGLVILGLAIVQQSKVLVMVIFRRLWRMVRVLLVQASFVGVGFTMLP